MSIRSFIAIELSDEIKNGLSEPILSLGKSGADIKWVVPANLHITLKFLGNIKEDQIEDISTIISRISADHMDFDFSITGTGTFPEGKRPRIIWAGIKDHEKIHGVYRDIEAELEIMGFKPENRPFRPHITIGRVRSQRGIDNLMEELVKYRHMDFGKQTAEEIHLMKSILKPGGAEYNKIFSAQLRR
ncbi:MAG: RNA 2',3'-cyclic phosphodiesterase [Nitrospirota bacterium]|nr:MAG: RNA 2',3'-cyclic phosphodiesterase [Nitrospirota bacterium]